MISNVFDFLIVVELVELFYNVGKVIAKRLRSQKIAMNALGFSKILLILKLGPRLFSLHRIDWSVFIYGDINIVYRFSSRSW